MSFYENITELRQLLREIEPLPPVPVAQPVPVANDAETRQRRAFEWYDFNSAGPVLEQSDRDRALRRIRLIAAWRPWGETVVMRALDAARVASLDSLEDDQVFALREQIDRYEDAAQCGCDADDEPPAR